MPRASLLLFCLLGACAIGQPNVPMQAFASGDLETVRQFARSEVDNGPPENEALVLNVLAQTELLEGRIDDAFQHFGVAARIMGNWQTSGSETFSAVVGSESSKTYKGDPYEKAMNAYYLGLLYLWRGEPDNARAAFKKGILADGESSDEKYQADFTLLFWLAGRMSRLMGLREDAEDFFKEAQKSNAFCIAHGSRGQEPNPVLQRPDQGNLVILVDIGLGPEKYAAGDQEELARYRPRFFPATGARVRLDDRDVGNTFVLTDVDYQARTRGGTEMEGIREGKAVFKSAAAVAGIVLLDSASRDHGDSARTQAIVGGSLLLLSLLTSTSADVRHWSTLPSTVQGLTLDAAPGPHRLTIEYFDAQGQVLANLIQHWSIDIPATGESYFLFRSLPGLDRRVLPASENKP